MVLNMIPMLLRMSSSPDSISTPYHSRLNVGGKFHPVPKKDLSIVSMLAFCCCHKILTAYDNGSTSAGNAAAMCREVALSCRLFAAKPYRGGPFGNTAGRPPAGPHAPHRGSRFPANQYIGYAR